MADTERAYRIQTGLCAASTFRLAVSQSVQVLQPFLSLYSATLTEEESAVTAARVCHLPVSRVAVDTFHTVRSVCHGFGDGALDATCDNNRQRVVSIRAMLQAQDSDVRKQDVQDVPHLCLFTAPLWLYGQCFFGRHCAMKWTDSWT